MQTLNDIGVKVPYFVVLVFAQNPNIADITKQGIFMSINVDNLEEVVESFHTGELGQSVKVLSNQSDRVFNPKFIPFYPEIKKINKLSWLETLLFGFIEFYLSSASDKFYFTNSQLGEMFGVSDVQISKGINKLSSKGLIDTQLEIRGGGGKLRYVRLIKKFISDTNKSLCPTQTKVYGNNNKINNNKIKEERNKNTTQRERQRQLIRKLDETPYKEILDEFNLLFKKRIKKDTSWVDNCSYWLETYTLSEIIKALRLWRYGPHWTKKSDFDPSLSFLFRTKNPKGEDVNRIQEMLNIHVPEKTDGINDMRLIELYLKRQNGYL